MTLAPSLLGEVTHYVADLSKARQLLGYSPKIPLDEGIAQGGRVVPRAPGRTPGGGRARDRGPRGSGARSVPSGRRPRPPERSLGRLCLRVPGRHRLAEARACTRDEQGADLLRAERRGEVEALAGATAEPT